MRITALPTDALSLTLAQLRLVRNIKGVKRTCRAFRDASPAAEQSHRRVLGSRGAGLFYYAEGGVKDRLCGPGFDKARGSIANAVLGLKPLDAGASKDIKRAERGEIARLAGWEGRLQAMEEQRARDRDLGPPPLGLGGVSAAAPSPPPPVVGVPSPPVARSPRGASAAEMDAVAKADALVRGDSVYSELASKYRSV